MAITQEATKALRKLSYGVYVVTLGKGEDGNGFTASWLSQVSSEPPLIALAVHNKHKSAWQLKEEDAFVVNLLPENEEGVAKAYYGPAESGYDKLKAKDISDAPATGTPKLNHAMGFLDCRIVNRVAAGNHTLFIAEVLAGELAADRQSLCTCNSKLRYTG